MKTNSPEADVLFLAGLMKPCPDMSPTHHEWPCDECLGKDEVPKYPALREYIYTAYPNWHPVSLERAAAVGMEVLLECKSYVTLIKVAQGWYQVGYQDGPMFKRDTWAAAVVAAWAKMEREDD